MLEGSLGSWNGIVNTLVRDHAAHPGRALGGLRLQGRPVQHRRPGPVPHGRPGRGGRGRRARGTRRPSSPSRLALLAGVIGGCASGASSRVCSRRSRAPTRWSRPSCSTTSRSPCSSWPVNGPLRVTGRAIGGHRRPWATPRCRSSSAATATPGIIIALHRGRRRELGPVPDDVRLRGPDRRRQPGRRPVRRHAAATAHRAHDVHLRPARRPRRRHRDAGHRRTRPPPSYATNVGFDAIAVALLGRSNPLGVLLAALLFGRHARRRQADADPGRHPVRAGRRAPGDDPASSWSPTSAIRRRLGSPRPRPATIATAATPEPVRQRTR